LAGRLEPTMLRRLAEGRAIARAVKDMFAIAIAGVDIIDGVGPTLSVRVVVLKSRDKDCTTNV
jgi:hypothetical protein